MRKRKCLLFILILSVLLIVTLAACNKGAVDPDKLPPSLGGDTPDGPQIPTSQSVRLEFTFPIAPSSVFSSIFVEDFDIERYVEYSVVYYDASGAITKKIPRGGVKKDMVAAEDQQYLTVAGHHNIHVTAALDDNSTVSGTFALHLKDKSGVISLVRYEFGLDSSHGVADAYFGSVADKKASVDVEVGAEIKDWNEFLHTFKMNLSGYALDSVTATSGGKQIVLGEGVGFPFTITESLNFTTVWTDDVVRINYDLNAPESKITTGHDDPAPLFGADGKYGKVYVKRGTGHALKPDDKEFDVYDGYFFAGWVNEATGLIYSFSSFVGNEDISLKAKWVAADYSFTIYTMGGEFVPDIQSSKIIKDGNEIVLTADNAAEYGYTLIECTSKFGLSEENKNKLSRVTFTGFHYGIDYNDYAAEVTVSSTGRKVVLKFEDIYAPTAASAPVFRKGDGSYLVQVDLYTDYQCTERIVRHDKVSTEQPVTYIKWVFDESKSGDEYLENATKWYTENLFKKGYTIKADGTVRLDKVADYAVNELIVPATLKIGGVERQITEIGDRACSNLRALTKVDLSQARYLTRLGVNAFAYDMYLKDIVMPEQNSIVEMGENAFLNTDFEQNYKKNTGGAEFIVINKMIYKYVGDDVTNIDLSDPSAYYTAENTPDMSEDLRSRLNNQLSKVEIIVDGAFANCPSLQSLKLPIGIKELQNNAFYGLSNLTELSIPKGSALTAIGESAFDGSGLLTESGNLYVPQFGAVIIGEVYYRLLNTGAETAEIPETHNGFTIRYIAPRAFNLCSKLADIRMANKKNIISIGKDAFLDTKYIQTAKDGYTVVNGILAAYYGPTYNANRVNLEVPADAVTIATNAFGNYARYFETLQINSTVKKIENNAFNGANMLKSIIFPDVRLGYKQVDNLPDIADNAFANSNGVMIGATYYFDAKVIEYFSKLESGKETTTDAITLKWLNLYTMHKSSFETEKIEYVQIDSARVAGILLRTGKYDAANPGKKGNAFLDKYGEDIIESALRVMPNTGIARDASLSWGDNEMALVEVTADGEYSQYYVAGITRYAITFKYNDSSEGCVPYIVTVYNAIMDAPVFNSSANYESDDTNVISLDGLNSENSNFWIEGLESQVEDSQYPTFYTSFNLGTVTFVYKDIDWKNKGDEKRITIDVSKDLEHFTTREVTNLSEAIINVNFHGIGKYKLKMSYSVVMSKFKTMKQNGAAVIPVNGNAVDYLKNYTVDMVGQDGIIEKYPITSSRFFMTGADGSTTIDTSVLGMHTLTLRYNGDNADGSLILGLNYTVVATADESLFEYDIVNEARKFAKIVKYVGDGNPVTVVIPSTTTKVKGHYGEEFTVVQIGEVSGTAGGVFQNKTTLTNVYLPETIRSIGVNTFAGCTLLSGVYTAKEISVTPVELNEDNFQKVGVPFEEKEDGKVWNVQNVTVSSLQNADYGEELVIGAEYVAGDTKFRVIGVSSALAVNDACNVVYLPDTVYIKTVIVKENGEKILPYFYDSDTKEPIVADGGAEIENAASERYSYTMTRIDARISENLTFIAQGAFMDCISLKAVDLSIATGLTDIGALAFAGSGLTSMDLSRNTLIKAINSQTFKNCSALSEATLSSQVEIIGTSAFDGCINLGKVSFINSLGEVSGYGRNLKRIYDNAFNRCLSLTSFEINATIENVGSNVFSSCNALTIYCRLQSSAASGWSSSWNDTGCPVVWNYDNNLTADDGYVYAVIGGIRYALDVETLQATVAKQAYSLEGDIAVPQTVDAEVKIDNVFQTKTFTVVAIGESAFEGNAKIVSVTVSSELKSIEQFAFRNCSGLTSFDFETVNGLINVSMTAFDGCDKLVQRPIAVNRE